MSERLYGQWPGDPRYSTVIPTKGPAGNIFAIIGTACDLLRQLRHPSTEIDAFRTRAMSAKSYAEACAVVREFFPLEGGDD